MFARLDKPTQIFNNPEEEHEVTDTWLEMQEKFASSSSSSK